jgi:hypothetical protein
MGSIVAPPRSPNVPSSKYDVRSAFDLFPITRHHAPDSSPYCEVFDDDNCPTRQAAWPPGKSNVDCPRMMIDDDTLKQLLRISDELLQLCKWLNEKRDMETSSRLIPHAPPGSHP